MALSQWLLTVGHFFHVLLYLLPYCCFWWVLSSIVITSLWKRGGVAQGAGVLPATLAGTIFGFRILNFTTFLMGFGKKSGYFFYFLLLLLLLLLFFFFNYYYYFFFSFFGGGWGGGGRGRGIGHLRVFFGVTLQTDFFFFFGGVGWGGEKGCIKILGFFFFFFFFFFGGGGGWGRGWGVGVIL